MKMRHIVKLHNGTYETYDFHTKAESDKALTNAFSINKTFNTIKCIWVEPINKPWKRQRIDL
jgi:ribosomal protein S6